MMKKSIIVSVLSALGLMGCPSDNKTTTQLQPMVYEVQIQNNTENQEMSPTTIVLHQKGYSMFQLAEAASVAMEHLAEGGDNAMLMTEAKTHANVLASVATNGNLAPGMSSTPVIRLQTPSQSGNYLSFASRLMSTNDGFMGESGVSLDGLAVNQRLVLNVPAWDAGTEADLETTATVTTQGFNAARDDTLDRILTHPNVLANELSTSNLNATHRFNGPVARVTITRRQ